MHVDNQKFFLDKILISFIKSYVIGDNNNDKEYNNNYELMYIIRIHYNTEIFLHLCNQI